MRDFGCCCVAIFVEAIAADGAVVETWPVKWTLRGLLPGETPARWATQIERTTSRDRACTLALRVVNPMSGGKRLRFANAAEDRAAKEKRKLFRGHKLFVWNKFGSKGIDVFLASAKVLQGRLASMTHATPLVPK